MKTKKKETTKVIKEEVKSNEKEILEKQIGELLGLKKVFVEEASKTRLRLKIIESKFENLNELVERMRARLGV